ncbi:MAG: hypothetical protein EU548_08090, partial [Promethearchaeota archaeon]
YKIEIPEQSILTRRLLLTGELIKSHTMHFFFQAFPDLLTLFDEKAKVTNQYELIQYNPQLTTFAYELIKIGNDIDKLFGGKAVHMITSVPGGMIYYPSNKTLSLAKRYFQKALNNLEWIIETFINLFSSKTPPPEYNVDSSYFISLHNNGKYDRYSGILGMRQSRLDLTNFLLKNYANYFDKDPLLYGININQEEEAIVGPLARYHIIDNYGLDSINEYLDFFSKEWYENILFANFLRLLEMYNELTSGLAILDDPCLNQRMKLKTPHSINDSDGIGVVEAPRGLLLHHYHLNKKQEVDSVKLFIPTELNIPIINKMITEYGQKLYEKSGDLNLVKEKVQMIIRAFDPCISCATY